MEPTSIFPDCNATRQVSVRSPAGLMFVWSNTRVEMPLGDADLRSDRNRSPGAFLLDDPEACHAYAWLFRHGPASVEAYATAVNIDGAAARLSINRLHAHGLLAETDGQYEAGSLNEIVEGVRVTPGVAAVLATQLENYAVRKLVRRHGALSLAAAVGCWAPLQEGRLQSRDVGERVGIGEHDGVTATNALRAVAAHLERDPYLAEIPVPGGPVPDSG